MRIHPAGQALIASDGLRAYLSATFACLFAARYIAGLVVLLSGVLPLIYAMLQ